MDDMIYMIDKLHLAGIMPVVITDGQFQILSCRENLFHIGRFFEDNADLWMFSVKRQQSRITLSSIWKRTVSPTALFITLPASSTVFSGRCCWAAYEKAISGPTGI